MKNSKFWRRLLAVSAVMFFITILLGNAALKLGGYVPLVNSIVESLFVIYGLVALISIIMAIRAAGTPNAKIRTLNEIAGMPVKANDKTKTQDEITDPAAQYNHAISFSDEQEKMKWLEKSAEQGYKPALDILYGMLKAHIDKAPKDGFDSGFGNEEIDAQYAYEWIFDFKLLSMTFLNNCKYVKKDKRFDALIREYYETERKALKALQRVEDSGDTGNDNTGYSTADIDTIGPGNPWF